MRTPASSVAVIALAFLAACSGDQGQAPSQPVGPSLVISDGAHSAGNPEFFFLSPLVKGAQASPNWTPGSFNPNLRPTVTICALDLAPTAPESAVQPGTPCRPGGYAITFPFGTSGDVVKLHAATGEDVEDDTSDGPDGHYHVNWKIPKTADVFFRARVMVGAVQLGYADVETVTTGSGLKNVNTGEFIARKDGTNAPIKFRIENRALCANPGGTGPCASASVNLGQGGTVSVTTDPLTPPSGVAVPPQGSQTQTVTVTVQTCADLNPRAIDLPTFGSCLRITTDPVLAQPLNSPATVFVCDYPPDVSALSHDQAERVTLHHLKTNGIVEALPHADAACLPTSASIGTRLDGMLRYAKEGRWRAAGQQLIGLIGPAPLVALDRGGGGLAFDFSDFQFALPGKVAIVSGDGQTAAPGTTLPNNPTVQVTDFAGDPVQGATVRFAGTGTVGSAAVVTNAAGMAQTPWTIAAGANQLSAGGRGIAGTDFNGPRPGVDPFMAIQNPFDPGVLAPWTPVDLKTGSVFFTATGVNAATLPITRQSPNYYYKVVAHGAEPGFPGTGGTAGFSIGTAAFGTPNSGCGLNTTVATPWALGTDILVRKSFTVPAATGIKIAVAIDNDVQVFLDGVDITSTAIDIPPGGLVGGFLIHEGCPELFSWIFPAAVSAGVHELAIRGRDRGGQAFLDLIVEVYNP